MAAVVASGTAAPAVSTVHEITWAAPNVVGNSDDENGRSRGNGHLVEFNTASLPPRKLLPGLHWLAISGHPQVRLPYLRYVYGAHACGCASHSRRSCVAPAACALHLSSCICRSCCEMRNSRSPVAALLWKSEYGFTGCPSEGFVKGELSRASFPAVPGID